MKTKQIHMEHSLLCEFIYTFYCTTGNRLTLQCKPEKNKPITCMVNQTHVQGNSYEHKSPIKISNSVVFEIFVQTPENIIRGWG